MAGTYSIVRPYPGTLGEKVETFAAGFGLTPALGQPPAAGTPDDQTARWLARSVARLLVVPFHFHRGEAQEGLDGIGVLLALPPSFEIASRVLFMPVRSFSWSTTFQARYQTFRLERPDLSEHVIVSHEDDIESPSMVARTRRALEIAEGQRSRPPGPRLRPVSQNGLEFGSLAQRPLSIELLEAAQRPEAGPASVSEDRVPEPPRSASRRSRARRTSGGWKFALPPDPIAATVPPASGERSTRRAYPLYTGDEKKKSNG